MMTHTHYSRTKIVFSDLVLPCLSSSHVASLLLGLLRAMRRLFGCPSASEISRHGHRTLRFGDWTADRTHPTPFPDPHPSRDLDTATDRQGVRYKRHVSVTLMTAGGGAMQHERSQRRSYAPPARLLSLLPDTSRARSPRALSAPWRRHLGHPAGCRSGRIRTCRRGPAARNRPAGSTGGSSTRRWGRQLRAGSNRKHESERACACVCVCV